MLLTWYLTATNGKVFIYYARLIDKISFAMSKIVVKITKLTLIYIMN